MFDVDEWLYIQDPNVLLPELFASETRKYDATREVNERGVKEGPDLAALGFHCKFFANNRSQTRLPEGFLPGNSWFTGSI